MEEFLHLCLLQANTRWHDPEANRVYYADLLKQEKFQADIFILPETFTSGFSNEAITAWNCPAKKCGRDW